MWGRVPRCPIFIFKVGPQGTPLEFVKNSYNKIAKKFVYGPRSMSFFRAGTYLEIKMIETETVTGTLFVLPHQPRNRTYFRSINCIAIIIIIMVLFYLFIQ